MLGNFSRAINRLCGGKPGETLCARWTGAWGSDCLPCRLVGWVLRDPHHCLNQFIYERGKKENAK